MAIDYLTISYFLVGVVMGGATVGSSINRTIAVYKGNMVMSLLWNLLNAVSYFIGIYFVVHENYIGFLGTVLGSCIAVLQSTMYQRKHNGNQVK